MELVKDEPKVETAQCVKAHLTKNECMALSELLGRCPLKGNEAMAFAQLCQKLAQISQTAE